MTPKRLRAAIVGLIVIGVLIVGFFGWRTMHAFRDFRGHRPPPFGPEKAEQAETDVELIRDWMTIPFIEHTYRVPPRVLFDKLGITPKGNNEKSLKQLNDEFFPDQPGYVVLAVKNTVRQYLPPVAVPSVTAASTSAP